MATNIVLFHKPTKHLTKKMQKMPLSPYYIIKKGSYRYARWYKKVPRHFCLSTYNVFLIPFP